MIEKTLVLIKHDGVARSLVGKIISRFEEIGLKIAAMKMLWATEELTKNHYILDENWAKNIFEKNKSSAEKENRKMKYRDHMEMGKAIQHMNSVFLREGPVIALILEGPHAIEIVRKMVGTTEPRQSPPGTIRGDFAMIESYQLSDSKNRVLRNLIHASDSKETADREINLWFSNNEIHSYKKDLDRHF